jgi:WD40 repeat protein
MIVDRPDLGWQYIVTAGLDKKVVMWDLATLKYRFTRTGHTAGVECLAFDGRSIVLAGGYDTSIIAWDLEAQIDRPLFVLLGHGSCPVKIIGFGAIDRCLALDGDGDVCWWDASKFSTLEPEERLIDRVSAKEDHVTTMSVYQGLGLQYETLNGIMLVAAGRRQHTYKFVNYGHTVSAPLMTLFSSNLVTLYTIHTHDMIFWR